MEAKTSEWRPGPTVCRCCLTEGCYKDISTEYFWMGKREVYAEMLADTLNLTIAYSQSGGPNSNSRLICEPCISRLRDAADFKRQVLECEKTFLQHLDPSTSGIVAEDVSRESILKGKQVKIELVKLEKLESDDDDFEPSRFTDDDDVDDDIDDQPLTKLAKTPKKETVDLLDLIDNAKVAEKRKSTTKVKATPVKKAKPKKETKTTANQDKPEKKKKGSDSTDIQATKRIVPLFQVDYDRSLCRPLGTVTNFKKVLAMAQLSGEDLSSRSPSPIYMDRAPSPQIVHDRIDIPQLQEQIPQKNIDIRQNALTLFEFSTVYPFVYGNNKFKCFICSQPFLETSLLKRHMQDTHTYAPIKRLVNNRRENVIKVDVSEMGCKLCPHKPKDLQELKVHLKVEHHKLIEPDLKDNIIPFVLEGDEEGYKCVMCESKFIKVRTLVIHMSVHFNNYSCEICGSGFMTLRLLKKHLEVHESGNFHCDRCNKVFNTSYKLSLHIRGVHLKQYPRRCPICPERFNSNYRRTKHLQDVHNQSTRVHKCKTCGRGFNLRYHLVCHTRSVHLQERNHQCKICLQRFCNKETLKRHMVIHTGEKNYKCEMCGEAFLRRKNLRDHLRVHEVL
ncbi:zinc finger protein 714 isoform X3 [Papilio machaon]|uniref:zinc finger protein 714 isoform X3 n=1 Tax=Papilio machaon TaxID=76193 RepID=UPI001E663335|nr:zinc finger protein 714 isoform X3 [Papilio machaon]